MRYLLPLFVLLAVACNGRRTRTPDTGSHAPRLFLPAIPPSQLPPEERLEWMLWHYWDKFDFQDTLFLAEADSTMMLEAFAKYIVLLEASETDNRPMEELAQRASASRRMLDYFAWMAREVVHDPNSPLRNDEWYIPILEAQLSGEVCYDEYERIGLSYEYRIAIQNRIGQPANDFRYTLASGATGTLYGLQAEYVLLFINNPGCPMCREIREALTASPMLNELLERGRLKVLALYPDEELDEWYEYRSQMPEAWINAYDAGCLIRQNLLYDLTAIPSLYLFDRQKRVLVKDSVDVADIEEAIDRAE